MEIVCLRIKSLQILRVKFYQCLNHSNPKLNLNHKLQFNKLNNLISNKLNNLILIVVNTVQLVSVYHVSNPMFSQIIDASSPINNVPQLMALEDAHRVTLDTHSKMGTVLLILEIQTVDLSLNLVNAFNALPPTSSQMEYVLYQVLFVQQQIETEYV